MNRREILTKLGLSAAGIPLLTKNIWKGPEMRNVDLPGQISVLFQGDSITDAGRDRGHYYANDARGMGSGYVRYIVTQLMGKYPKIDWSFYNRGISGNKVFQLSDRWEEDCLQLKPNVLSILIGVNDFWHTLTGDYPGNVEVYEHDFRKLIQRTKTSFPNIKLIIGEPFVVTGGSAVDDISWTTEFPRYRKIARKISEEFNGIFIPYQSLFDKALKEAEVSFWCPDGVHPSMAGAYIMGNAWLEAFFKLYS